MMRKTFKTNLKLLVCFTFLLSACGENNNSQALNEPIIILGDDVNTLAIARFIDAGSDIMTGLEAGQVAILEFNKCPETEEFKKADPLGSLLCSEKYKIWWDQNKQAWTAIGPNEALPLGNNTYGLTAGIYPGAAPVNKEIIVWGLSFTINPNNEISYSDYGVIGTLSIADGANSTNATNTVQSNSNEIASATSQVMKEENIEAK